MMERALEKASFIQLSCPKASLLFIIIKFLPIFIGYSIVSLRQCKPAGLIE